MMNRSSSVLLPARGWTLFAAVALIAVPRFATSDVVISQVYGGGGVPGAAYKHDFIELFNDGGAPVDITGWSVHRWNSVIPESQKIADLSGTIDPGHYHLVQFAGDPQAVGADLPAPDVTVSATLQPNVSNYSLVTGSNQYFCQEAERAMDQLGYGGLCRCCEGTPLGSPNGTAMLRLMEGCTDTQNNLADFSIGPPNPRNSTSPAHVCATTDVSDPSAMSSTRLELARPNPSASGTELVFAMGRDGPVRIAVFDLHGRRLRLLADRWRPAGEYRVSWDGTDEDGAAVPAGVYFARFEAARENVRETLRFMRVR